MEAWELEGVPRVFDAPWPVRWRRDRRMLIAADAVLLLIAAGAMVGSLDSGDWAAGDWASRAWASRDWASGLAVAGAALALAAPSLLMVTMPRGRAEGVGSCADEPGLEFHTRAATGLATTLGAVAVLAMLAGVVAAIFQGLGWPTAIAIAVVVVGAGEGWMIATQRRKTRPPAGPLRLLLTPSGVTLRGRLGTRTVSWDDEPFPVPMPNGALHVPTSAYLHELASSPKARRRWWWRAHLQINGGYFAVDNAAVAAAIAFYGFHPERRSELGTIAAVERVRRGDLPYPWAIPTGTIAV